MKINTAIESNSLIKMIEDETRAEKWKYISEIKSPLSQVIERADALGPLVVRKQVGAAKWILIANASYSRFRIGDRVELRVKDVNADLSTRISKGWRVELVEYPAPGKIEITISGHVPLESERLRELYLFRDYTEAFSGHLIKKIRELQKSVESTT